MHCPIIAEKKIFGKATNLKLFEKKLLFYRLSIRSEKYTVKGKDMAGGEGKEVVF
jgi:hypothetical protein